MAVELLDDKKLWDQFVENSPQGTLFHTWDFLKIVERHSGSQLLPYAIFSGNELRCIFPFFITRRLGLTTMRSPPRDAQIPYLGFAFYPSVAGLRAHRKEKILQQVTDEVCKEIDKISPNYVSFKTVPNFIDVRTFGWKNYSIRPEFTYAIDLEKPLDDIWSGFNKRCKRGINHVSTLSPHVEHTNDVSLVLGMWRERRKERGERQNLFSDSYLEELAAAFPQRVTVHSVSIDGSIAGATACCVLRGDRYGLWIGGVNARRDLHTNEFLTWEVIQHAKSKGFKMLDMIGATWPPRLSRFKSKFDPVLEPYYYVEKTDALGKIANFAGSKLAGSRLRVKQILPRRSRRESNDGRT
jgi:hypothetical protein